MAKSLNVLVGATLDSNVTKNLNKELSNLDLDKVIIQLGFDESSVDGIKEAIKTSLTAAFNGISFVENEAKEIGQSIGENIAKGLQGSKKQIKRHLDDFVKQTDKAAEKITQKFVKMYSVNPDGTIGKKISDEIETDYGDGRKTTLVTKEVKGNQVTTLKTSDDSQKKSAIEAEKAAKKAEKAEEARQAAIAESKKKYKELKSEFKKAQKIYLDAVETNPDFDYSKEAKALSSLGGAVNRYGQLIKETGKSTEWFTDLQKKMSKRISGASKIETDVSKATERQLTEEDRIAKKREENARKEHDRKQKELEETFAKEDKLFTDELHRQMDAKQAQKDKLYKYDLKLADEARKQEDADTVNLGASIIEARKEQEKAAKEKADQEYELYKKQLRYNSDIYAQKLEAEQKEHDRRQKELEETFASQDKKDDAAVKLQDKKLNKLKQVNKQYDVAAEKLAKLENVDITSMSDEEIDTLLTKTKGYREELQKAYAVISNHESTYHDIVEAQKKITTLQKQVNASTKEYSAADKIYDKLNLFNNETTRMIGKLRNQYGDLFNEEEFKKVRDLQSEINRIIKEQGYNEKAVAEAIRNAASKTKDFTTKLSVSKKEIEEIRRQADLLDSSLGRFIQFYGFGELFRGFKTAFRDIATNIKEIDSSMTELRKVTEETDYSYDRFLENAANRSKELGVALKDYVDSVTNFARMGYDFQESQTIAETANIMQMVSESLTADDASSYLISIMAAYGIEAKKSMEIVDALNNVSNNFSITIEGLGEALKRGGASLSAANNSLEESIALAATANEVIQNPETVGNALKTISMRIRGVVSAEDEDGDSVLSPAKLGKEIERITAKYTDDGKGISILASPDEFKSTYDILLELSKVWEDLSDTEQAYLLEKIAGKHRATALQAILSNTETLQRAYDEAMNSANSAMKEFEKRTESVEYHLNQLKASWQELSVNTLSVDWTNRFIDIARGIVELVNKIGALNVVFGSVGAMGGLFTQISVIPALLAKFESLRKPLETLDKAEQTVKIFGKEISVADKNMNTLKKSSIALGSILNGLGGIFKGMFAGAAAMLVITKVFDLAADYYNKTKNEVAILGGEIDEISASITSLKEEMASLEEGGVTEGERGRIALLEKQIKLEERSLELKKQQRSQSFLNSAGDYFGGKNNIIDSAFEDDMQKADKAVNAFAQNLEYLDNTAEALVGAEEKMAEYLDNVVMYEEEIVALNQLQTEYAKAQANTNTLYTDAADALKQLYTYQDDFNWVIKNGTAEQAEAARIRKIDLDIKIYEYEVMLGLADTYENAAKKLDKYNSKLSVLGPIAEKANKENKISKADMEALKKVYPELAEEIEEKSKVVGDAYVLEKSALNALNDEHFATKETVIQAEIDKTSAVVAEAQKRIQAYLLETESLKTLEDAYAVWQTEQEKLGDHAYSGMGGSPYLSKDYIQYQRDLKTIEESQYKLAELQERMNQLKDDGSGDGTETELGSGNGDGAGSSWDKYANSLANAREEIERYNAAIDVAQSRLDLNQSFEERTVDLLTEEVEIYDDLLAAQEAKYKIVNDTLWLQSEQLKVLQQQASEKIQSVAGIQVDASEIAKWTAADVEAFVIKAKLDVDENEAHADLQNFLNSLVDMRDGVADLHSEWYDLKKEIRETRKQELQSIIDWQNESLNKFDDARKQTEAILDLLEDVEDTERERMNLASGLVDSYDAQKESILSMHRANAAKMNELASDLENNQETYQMLLKQNKELEENYLDALQSQLSYKQQLLDLEQEYAEQLAETEIYGSQGRDKWEDARQDEIDSLNDQIESLRKEAEEDDYAERMAEYEEELAEKQEEIAELYQKLDNLRSQKTIQTLKQQEDGSFQWEYVEDQIAINETLQEIADKEVEIEEVKNEIKEAEEERALEEQIAYLEAQIEAIEDEVERRQELYDEECELIDTTYQRQKQQLSVWLQEEIANWQARIAASEANLKKYDQVNVEGWNTATVNTDVALTELKEVYSEQFAAINSVIQAYEQQAMRSIANVQAAIAAAKAAAREAAAMERGGADGSHAMGLKFVEANNYIARLHYGERVLTRQEARQYNELEEDIKSGNLKAYFETAKLETANSISNAVRTGIRNIGGSGIPTTTSSNTSFVIEHLELPQVHDATDFAAVLNNWARGEFSGLAQKAKIVRSR